MAGHYSCTLQRPTICTEAIRGHFTGPHDVNLIQVKSTSLEVYKIGPGGLVPIMDTNIYGRIQALKRMRIAGEDTDVLFVSTETYHCFVLGYDQVKAKLVTRAKYHDVGRIGRPSETGQKAFIDHEHRLIGMQFFDGNIKLIPMATDGSFQDAIDLKTDELCLISVAFLLGTSKPTLACLSEQRGNVRVLNTYRVDVGARDMVKVMKDTTCESTANRIVPLPNSTMLVLSDVTARYYTKEGKQGAVAHMVPSVVMATCVIDDNRILLGTLSENRGVLYILVIQPSSANNGVMTMKIEILGNISVPSAIAYLDESVLFVGSMYGDSQLVKLRTTQCETTGFFVDVLESFTNLGPILDFAVVDLDRRGQNQLVTCSGAFSDGSLRVIRNGIGINQLAELEIPGIQEIWALSQSASDPYNSVLAVSLVGQTAFLSVSGEDLEGMAIPGASCTEESLYCGNACGDCWVQVVQSEVKLIDASTHSAIASWKPPPTERNNDGDDDGSGAKSISMCSCDASTHMVVASGPHLWHLTMSRAEGFTVVSTATLEHEIACLDISSDYSDASKTENADDDDVKEEAVSTPNDDADVEMKSPPRMYCIVGLWSDISVRVLQLSDLTELHKELLGGEIIPRSIVMTKIEKYLYAFCALGDGSMFSFHLDPGTGSLSARKFVHLGTKPISLSVLQHNGKPHVFAAPYRIVHQATTKTFGVVVHMDQEKVDVPLGQIRLLNEQTFEELDVFQLDDNELPLSITSGKLSEEDEPTSGRLILLGAGTQKFHLVSAQVVKGAVYTCTCFHDMLLVGCNSAVELYGWDGEALSNLYGYYGYITVLTLKTLDNLILVGDLMRSITLLEFSQEKKKIEEVAMEPHSYWMTAVEFLDAKTFLGAEQYFNFFTCQREVSDTISSEKEEQRLTGIGEYHIGQYVNEIRAGSLDMRPSDPKASERASFLFCTQGGSIGMITALSPTEYEFFERAQKCAASLIAGVGDIPHEAWRAFRTERHKVDVRGFVDGDLVEEYLDLPAGLQNKALVKDLVQHLDLLGRLNYCNQPVFTSDHK